MTDIIPTEETFTDYDSVAESYENELTLEQKVDYIFNFIQQLEPLIAGASEQLGPVLEKLSKNPMLKMFGL